MKSVSKGQVHCVNDVNEIMNSTDFPMHPVKEVDVPLETVFLYECSTLVVSLFELRFPLDEGFPDLKAGGQDSTLPLKRWSTVWSSILMKRRIGGLLHFPHS